ncbi:hypothetical protein ACWDPV_08920 [Gordonia sp. NPDC003504]
MPERKARETHPGSSSLQRFGHRLGVGTQPQGRVEHRQRAREFAYPTGKIDGGQLQ